MKRALIVLALTGAASVALAQTRPMPMCDAGWGGAQVRVRVHMRRMQQWRMHQLTVLLGLTGAQRQQVKAILRQQRIATRRNIKPFRQAMHRAFQQMRAAQRATHKQTLERLSRVLNPEQLAKFKVLMPPPGFAVFHRPHRGGPPRRPPPR